MHLLLDRGDEAFDVVAPALGLELHAAIGQVAHEACDIEPPRHLQDGVPKPHSLDMAAEQNRLVMHVCHRAAQRSSAVLAFNPQNASGARFLAHTGERIPHLRKPLRGAWQTCAAAPGFYLHFRPPAAQFRTEAMSNFDSDSGSDGEWEDRGDLAWNEFDWERYLREQDEAIQRYWRFYETTRQSPGRIDEVAEKMGWGQDEWTDDEPADGDDAEEEDESEDSAYEEAGEVYTLHKNPIFIATKAIYLGLQRSWQGVASDPLRVPQPLAMAMLASLHRGEEQAVQAIHALDFGDYAMAISLFKRALSELNSSLTFLSQERAMRHRAVAMWREDALPRLFDLREIWLRVIAECREELERPIDDED